MRQVSLVDEPSFIDVRAAEMEHLFTLVLLEFEVKPGNLGAARLYQRFGFREVGRRRFLKRF